MKEPLKTDPLIVHYRDDNIRLECAKELLEEKIKDLENSLMEHKLNENSCDSAKIIRGKMRVLRVESHLQKKK